MHGYHTTYYLPEYVLTYSNNDLDTQELTSGWLARYDVHQ